MPTREGPDAVAAVVLALLFGTLGLAYVRGWGVALQATAGALAFLFVLGVVVPDLLLIGIPLLWIGVPIYAYSVAKQETRATQEAATRCMECGMPSPEHKSWCASIGRGP